MTPPACYLALWSLAALSGAFAPASALGQTIPPACRPMIDAERKRIMTPHHAYVTETSAGRPDSKETHESISAGGVTYIQMGGTWRKSPLAPKEMLDQMQENLAHAKVLTCRRLPDASVGGVSAAVYSAHSETEDATTDTQSWIATSSGLVVRQEEDLDAGVGGKRHLSLRYEYTDVRAPAGAN